MGSAVRLLHAVFAAIGALALLLGAPVNAGRWGKNYVPNVPVVTQDGKVFRFYDNLIKDKIFVISFFYAACSEICPLATARLSELQEALGDDLGRDIFFYTISIDPENDTPERLKKYAEAMHAGPGWLFLTGIPEDIKVIRDKLGDRGKFLNEHRNEVLLGNGATGEWQRDNPLSDLTRLAMTIRAMKSDWRVDTSTLSRWNEKIASISSDQSSAHALFAKACAGCHTIGRGDRVGPDLAGVSERRQMDWLARFIVNPEKVRNQKDPIALGLAAKYPTVRMPAMGISESEAFQLVAYVNARQSQQRSVIPLDPLLALTTHAGTPLPASDLAERSLVVVFGYTHCPDVCPTALLEWSNVLEGLGPDAQRLKVLFVSVDSERDTPDALKAYLQSFHPGITALTGTPEQVAAVAAIFEAFFAKNPGLDGNFTYDHTIKIYLVDRERGLFGTLDLDSEPAVRRGLLERLLARHDQSR